MRKNLGLVLAALIAASVPAVAGTISIGGTTINATASGGTNTNYGSEAAICTGLGLASGCLGGSTLLYKAEVDGGSEAGNPLSNSYTTTFTPSDDPSGGTIAYNGSPLPYATCPSCYLLVKDGNNAPAQYLFNLGNWDGQATITLTGFWPNQGAISNVAIWGNETVTTPDGGATLSLLGGVLFGLGILRRKFKV